MAHMHGGTAERLLGLSLHHSHHALVPYFGQTQSCPLPPSPPRWGDVTGILAAVPCKPPDQSPAFRYTAGSSLVTEEQKVAVISFRN